MKSSLFDELTSLIRRKDRFTYDLRGRCQVYAGVVAAYRMENGQEHYKDLSEAIAHALEHDGIIGAWKDPATRETVFDSCRLFTAQETAVLFAQQQEQKAVYNLNREYEVFITTPEEA